MCSALLDPIALHAVASSHNSVRERWAIASPVRKGEGADRLKAEPMLVKLLLVKLLSNCWLSFSAHLNDKGVSALSDCYLLISTTHPHRLPFVLHPLYPSSQAMVREQRLVSQQNKPVTLSAEEVWPDDDHHKDEPSDGGFKPRKSFDWNQGILGSLQRRASVFVNRLIPRKKSRFGDDKDDDHRDNDEADKTDDFKLRKLGGAFDWNQGMMGSLQRGASAVMNRLQRQKKAQSVVFKPAEKGSPMANVHRPAASFISPSKLRPGISFLFRAVSKAYGFSASVRGISHSCDWRLCLFELSGFTYLHVPPPGRPEAIQFSTKLSKKTGILQFFYVPLIA